MEFLAFVETPELVARVVFSGRGRARLPPEAPWPKLPLATWGTEHRKEVLDVQWLCRVVWPEDTDRPSLARRTGRPLTHPDPWIQAEALGDLVLLAMEEVSTWPKSARHALARALPTGWSLPSPRPRFPPAPPPDLATAFHTLREKGLSYRPSQEAYAQAVKKVLDNEEIALLEAGPGTGKTFGYLIPLLLHLRKGGRAVVATRTRTLQDQLWKKDLPWLEENLDLRVERALLKGRENYVCLRRLWEMEGRLIPEELLFPLKVLALRGGDLDEAGFLEEAWWLEDLRDRPWRCLGPRCRGWEACPSRRAREKAQAAQLVVVNHALLGADLARDNALLGPYDYLVVDEAHALPQALREALGLELNPEDLPLLLGELRRLGWEDEKPRRLEEEVRRVHEEFWDLARAQLPPGRSRLKPETAASLTAQAQSLSHAVEELARALKAKEEGAELLSALLSYKNAMEQVLSPGPGAWVQWFSREEEVTLGLTPLDLGEILSQRLWPKVKAAVLTSATLAVGGSPAFLLRRLGLPEETPFQGWPSPFTYERVKVALLAGLPEPDDPGYPRALAEVLRRVVSQVPAKILVLFTARRALASLHELLRDVPHLAQGWDGERDQLLRKFRLMPAPAILLGLESFWEGVDLPGPELEVLVVARLPFSHPAEPVLEAEAERLRAQGKNEFRELSLPLAVLKLRQGLGRLVRTPEDRGVILIADSRLASRSYRSSFLGVLPVEPEILRQPEEVDVVLRAVFR